MANLFEMYSTDPSLEVNGFWYEYDDETAFLLARAGGENMEFLKAVETASRPYRRQLDSKQGVSAKNKKVVDKIAMTSFVEAVLLNWRGVKDRDGNDLPYSKSNAKDLLTQLPGLFEELLGESQRHTNFQKEDLEEDAKN